MVNALPSTSNASPTPTHEASSEEKTALDKDAFLKLLVAQLSHQDPLQPMEGAEFVAQLSQFAMVEQAISQSAKLDALSTQVRGLANNEATALVGKTVTIRGHGMVYDGVTATSASANLAGPADRVTVRVLDPAGKTVRTIELGSRAAGPLPIVWDGKNDVGQQVAKGTYDVRIEATTKDGSKVAASRDVSGQVARVTFEKGYPEIVLESGVTAPISDLVSVGGAGR